MGKRGVVFEEKKPKEEKWKAVENVGRAGYKERNSSDEFHPDIKRKDERRVVVEQVRKRNDRNDKDEGKPVVKIYFLKLRKID